jgi:glycine/D-amino acid oxidase-like deaminating enzyme
LAEGERHVEIKEARLMLDPVREALDRALDTDEPTTHLEAALTARRRERELGAEGCVIEVAPDRIPIVGLRPRGEGLWEVSATTEPCPLCALGRPHTHRRAAN